MNLVKVSLFVVLLAIGAYLSRIYYFCGCAYSGSVRVDGKTVIVTGANTGIGLETARGLAARGGRVIMACRDLTRCNAARDDIMNSTSNVNITTELLDLASFESVRNFAERFLATKWPLDILINNAGLTVHDYSETQDGFEATWQVNYLSHFLLTHLLMDRLRSSAPSRVINVSSRMHYMGVINFDDLNLKENYGVYTSYTQSKLANILHAFQLAKHLKGTGVTAVSLHPGLVNTEMSRKTNPIVKPLALLIRPLVVKTPSEGAQTSLHCALDPSVDQHSGEYFSDCQTMDTPGGSDEEVAERLWKTTERLLKLA